MILSGGQVATISRVESSRLGDAVPLLGGGSYYARNYLELSGEFAAYGAMYRAQPWVYTLVTKLARSGARLPFVVHTKDDDGGRTPAVDSPYGTLMANPTSTMDPFMFWLWVMSTLELYGEAILWKWRLADGRVAELFPLHPINVTVKRNVSSGLLEYWYTAGSTASTTLIPPIPVADIVHFKTYNPDNTTRGMSWLEPLRQTLLADDASRRASASYWRNGSKPSFALETDGSLSDGASKRMAAQWAALQQGVDNWGKTVVLEEGVKAHELTSSPADMQYVETRKLTRDECCSVADVPPPVVHVLDNATFSNITEQMRSMYRDTMTPRLKLYEAVLDYQLRPEFGGSDLGGAFDLNSVLIGSPEMVMESNAKAVMTGQKTPNEARRDLGLGPLPDGDRLLVNAALIPLGTDANTAPTGTNVLEKPQSVKAQDKRSIMGRLGRLTGDVNKAALLNGMPDDVVRALVALPEVAPADEFRELVKTLEVV